MSRIDELLESLLEEQDTVTKSMEQGNVSEMKAAQVRLATVHHQMVDRDRSLVTALKAVDRWRATTRGP